MPKSKTPFQLTPVPLRKSPTGIAGFDEITNGGIPIGRTTLLAGGPGSGKTILALQILVNGARLNNEPGIFVAFEENAKQIRDNAATFGWDLPKLEMDKLFFLDARLSPSTVRTGGFELTGTLAAVAAKAKSMNAKRIVFDSLDALLYLLKDEIAEREELHRLQEWLQQNELTGILTAKTGPIDSGIANRFGFLQYMVDTVIELNHDLIERVATRHVRVLKYRGSNFADNMFPLIFGPVGVEIGGLGTSDANIHASAEKLSTGIPRLDTMLNGGYFRGSGILVSGSPGTAKTTLAGAFVAASCERGESAVFFSFDEWSNEVIRNLASVNIHLSPYIKKGLLRMFSAESESQNAEEHLLNIRNLLSDGKVKILVIDPISAMAKAAGGSEVATVAVQRLIRMTKSMGVTLFITSLLGNDNTLIESTPIQISTFADTWIHISYVINDGERNRALTVVKSRGSSHSNQVRELLLSDEGITLANVYASKGQVLMGTARWQQEATEKVDAEMAALELERRHRQLASQHAESKARMEVLQREIASQEIEAKLLELERATGISQVGELQRQLHELRKGDDDKDKKKA